LREEKEGAGLVALANNKAPDAGNGTDARLAWPLATRVTCSLQAQWVVVGDLLADRPPSRDNGRAQQKLPMGGAQKKI
jgi:hypothetical protein